MNILFVHEVDWKGKVVYDVHLLAEAMAQRGHDVYAIDYPDIQSNRESPNEEDVSRAINGAVVHLIHPVSVKVAIMSRISALVSHYFAVKKVIKEKSIDAIVLYSVPTNGLQAVYWARKFNIPIVFRSLDVLNQLVPYPPLRPITKYLERKVYSNVDGILTITTKLSEYVIGLGANPSKVGVLPMTVDTNLFCPSSNVEAVRQKWGLSGDDKIILFMGTLFNFSGLDTFIPKFKYVIAQEPKAKLLIVGDGSQRAELGGIIKTCGLEGGTIITGFQPYQDMSQYINLADVCINTFVSNPITKDIFPGKTVQFLACGKPLVMRPLDGVRAVISGEEQGVIYADSDNEIVSDVISLLRSDERRQEVGQGGLGYVRRVHAHEVVARQLEGILVGLIKERE